MRNLAETNQFKKDMKRERKGNHRAELDDILTPVLEALANDVALPKKNHDHDLTGDWAHHRECHVKPDLLLIYRKIGDVDAGTLALDRLGSHSELFG